MEWKRALGAYFSGLRLSTWGFRWKYSLSTIGIVLPLGCTTYCSGLTWGSWSVEELANTPWMLRWRSKRAWERFAYPSFFLQQLRVDTSLEATVSGKIEDLRASLTASEKSVGLPYHVFEPICLCNLECTEVVRKLERWLRWRKLLLSWENSTSSVASRCCSQRKISSKNRGESQRGRQQNARERRKNFLDGSCGSRKLSSSTLGWPKRSRWTFGGEGLRS